MAEPRWVQDQEGEVLLDVKAVPGAKRDEVVGPLGDALKVKVSAPAEGGKANRAVCALFAKALGVSKGSVSVVSGHGQPRKRVSIRGIDRADLLRRLGAETDSSKPSRHGGTA